MEGVAGASGANEGGGTGEGGEVEASVEAEGRPPLALAGPGGVGAISICGRMGTFLPVEDNPPGIFFPPVSSFVSLSSIAYFALRETR